MLKELQQILPESQILHSPSDLIAFASDASFYRLIPKAVVFPKNITEIQFLFEYSQKRGIAMTFRAAGTSLAGQAITDGILVETKRFWQGMRVEDEGKKIRVQPGIVGGQVNLKSTPTIEDIADKCIECGYCEHLCPSRELTLTPRQRIVVRREMARQELHSGNSPLLKELQQDFTYKGLDTCAGDGMCSTACPVGINK